MKDIHDVIKHAKFGDDRLRGPGVVAGQISAFPIDFAGRPYNTLTLPCERVIPRTAQTVLSVYLKRTCSRDRSASSVWDVNDNALYKSTHARTHSLTHSPYRDMGP